MRRFRSSTLGHELLYALRVVGLRDRYRCPGCQAVGTWKPHGGFLDGIYDRVHGERNTRLVRRWVCKYCGRYEGPEGLLRAWPDTERGWWVLPPPYDPLSGAPEMTPKEAVELNLDDVWPWRG